MDHTKLSNALEGSDQRVYLSGVPRQEFPVSGSPSSTSPSPASPPRSLPGIVRHFAPNWFAVTMGVGAFALVLRQIPGAPAPLGLLAMGLWLLNIGLFGVFSLLYGARWLLYPAEARRVFAHPVMSMFLGTIPMGLATIVNGFVLFGPDLIGGAATDIAFGLWILDALMAVACGLAVPFLMFTRQRHSFERMTAVWLLPLVAAGVAAASAGMLASHLDPAAGRALILAGYGLWAFSVPIAMSVLALLFLRLALHRLPEREMGPTAWLALGPIGTGALGLLLLGENAQALFAGGPLAGAGATAFGFGILGGLILWGYGLWWLGLAVLKTGRYLRGGLPFNLSWWAFTFPLAVYGLATLTLGRLTEVRAFDVAGMLIAAVLTLLWTVVAARTLAGVRSGALFVSPCLAPLPDEIRAPAPPPAALAA